MLSIIYISYSRLDLDHIILNNHSESVISLIIVISTDIGEISLIYQNNLKHSYIYSWVLLQRHNDNGKKSKQFRIKMSMFFKSIFKEHQADWMFAFLVTLNILFNLGCLKYRWRSSPKTVLEARIEILFFNEICQSSVH